VIPLYRLETDAKSCRAIELPTNFGALEDDPHHYLPEEDLVHAVNTALLLGRPLLVTGEPGTGKTQLAASVACQLHLGAPLTFVAKSVSQSQDLFYSYDALARFKGSPSQSAHASVGAAMDRDAVTYIRYNALG